MTRDNVKTIVLWIIHDIDEDIDTESLDHDVLLTDQVDLDSMETLDIVLFLKQRYNIHMSEEDYFVFQTITGLTDYLEPLLKDVDFDDKEYV